MVDAIEHFVLVLRKVDFEAGFHVKGLEGNPIFLLQTGEQRGGPVLPNVGKKAAVAVAAELEQQDHGDGSFSGRKGRDGLRDAIFEDAEVFFLETGDDVTMVRGGYNIEGDDGNVDGNGDAGLRRRRATLRAGGSLSG